MSKNKVCDEKVLEQENQSVISAIANLQFEYNPFLEMKDEETNLNLN